MHISMKPYWLADDDVKKTEEIYDAKYMGYWCTKNSRGDWNDNPVDVFYVENPDASKGHTHYFGIFYHGGNVYITEASTAFSEPMVGVLASDDEVLVSRYRYDYQEKNGVMIDGGRDYARTSLDSKMVSVKVKCSEFHFELENSQADYLPFGTPAEILA